MIAAHSTPQFGLVVWFTGLSGAGKTTLCRALEDALLANGFPVKVLDGDEMRQRLSPELGYSREDREENIRRIAAAAKTLVSHGTIALVAAISPYRAMRAKVRKKMVAFLEVYVNAPLATCIERDPKGLYRRALAGEIESFTGISDPYEPPLRPEVECATADETVEQSTAKVMAVVLNALLIHQQRAEANAGA